MIKSKGGSKGENMGNPNVYAEKRIVRLLCCIIPFSAMNIVMFNLALPDISAQYGTGLGVTGWVVTVFGIIYAVGAVLYGKLADLYGIKKLAAFGIAIFSAGSVLGWLAPNFGVLMAARIMQGIGASSIPTLSMLIPVRFVAAERRGRALGAVAATLAFSGAVGPMVGGMIIGMFHWKSLFLFSLGAVFTLPFIWKWLPEEKKNKTKMFDFWGAAGFVVAMVSLMLAATWYNVWWLTLSLCFLLVFFIRQRNAVNPFIPLTLFRNGKYRIGLMMGAFNAAVNFGVMMVTPLLLGQIYGLHASWIGFILFPGAVCASVSGYFGGKLIDRKGDRFVLRLAVVLLGLGLLSLSTFAGYTPWGISLCLILANTGYILMQPSLANWVSSALPAGRSGIGMGTYSLNNFLSTALSGTAVTMALERFDPVPVNPLALEGDSGIYSNVYFGLFVLTIVNMVFLFKFSRKTFIIKSPH